MRLSTSRCTAISIRTSPRIRERPSGFAVVDRADSHSPSGSHCCRGFSIACTTSSGRANGFEQEFESRYKDLIFETILGGLAVRTGRRRRLLDIGAHAGRFMHLAHAAGWQAEGIELNPRTAAFAASRTGLPVHSINVERLPLSTGSYGAITLIDVLEHVPHPMTLLTRAAEALEPGGWVVVKVPSGPAQRRKERTRAWLHRGYRPRLADNLVHVNHFSPTRPAKPRSRESGSSRSPWKSRRRSCLRMMIFAVKPRTAVRRALCITRGRLAAWWCQYADSR